MAFISRISTLRPVLLAGAVIGCAVLLCAQPAGATVSAGSGAHAAFNTGALPNWGVLPSVVEVGGGCSDPYPEECVENPVTHCPVDGPLQTEAPSKCVPIEGTVFPVIAKPPSGGCSVEYIVRVVIPKGGMPFEAAWYSEIGEGTRWWSSPGEPSPIDFGASVYEIPEGYAAWSGAGGSSGNPEGCSTPPPKTFGVRAWALLTPEQALKEKEEAALREREAREAHEREVEREGKEHAGRESEEKARESKAKAEREAKVKSETEAKEKAEREAREKIIGAEPPDCEKSWCPMKRTAKEAAVAEAHVYEKQMEELEVEYKTTCIGHDPEIGVMCAAYHISLAALATKRNEAYGLAKDPPDPRYRTVVRLGKVDAGRIAGRRFEAFDELMLDLARVGALQHAILVSANRESGAHHARQHRYETLQAGAIRAFAHDALAYVPRIDGLIAKADAPFANPPGGLHVVTFARLREAVSDLARTMRILIRGS